MEGRVQNAGLAMLCLGSSAMQAVSAKSSKDSLGVGCGVYSSDVLRTGVCVGWGPYALNNFHSCGTRFCKQ